MVVRMRRMVGALLGVGSALLLGACTVIGVRSGTERPPHAVIERLGPIEIRRYEARLAAETVVEGPEEEARSAGFRKLAAYIFGANRPAAKIAMTAPVEQQRIAMTAPVEQQTLPPWAAPNEDERIDPHELESARWFSRDDARALIASRYEGAFCPPPFAIAHQLLKTWSDK